MLHIEQLSKRFGRLQAVADVSVQLNGGQVVSLIGPNGSGKTTLIKCILGLVIPDRGRITVNGLSADTSWRYRRHIGYMPQISRFPENVQVRQILNMITDIRQFNGITDDELYHRFELAAYAEKKMGALSGGMRQKVNAAIAFLFHPEVYILDEPTAGLDPAAAEQLKEKIRQCRRLGRLILITTHNINDVAELSDTILLMFEGKLRFHGSPEALMQKTGTGRFMEALIKAYASNGTI